MSKHWILRALVIAALFSTVGCASTRQSNSYEPSGFLKHYSQLKPDEVGGHSWANPTFDLANFDAIHVPIVELWLSEENEDQLTPENAARLSSLFRTTLIQKMKQRGWDSVDEPGARIATIRIALTEVNGASSFGNVLTSLPYVTTNALQLLAITSDVHVFVGEASTEVQVLNGGSGEILAEGVDRRVGAHSMSNIGSTWGDIEDAIGVWTDRIAEGLAKSKK